MASYKENADVEADETRRLIASNKVEGTVVYNAKANNSGPSTTSWSTS